jgi:alkylation response protein AidB-like acyl-CoA dehydrogenase
MRDDLWTPLRESAKRFVTDLDGARADGFDRARWRKIAELGWLGLAVPEASGGAGLDASDLIPIIESFGAGCVAEPLIAVAGVAAPLIAGYADDKQRSDLLPPIVSGKKIVVLAHDEADNSAVATRAERQDDKWRVYGAKAAVIGGANADDFLITAHLPDGTLGLFVVPRDTAGLALSVFRSIDGRALADLSIDNVAASRLGDGDAGESIDTALGRGAMLTVADATGAMDALLADTLAYLKTRKQFGQTIGSFQALQHRAVDMYLALEETRAVVEAAANAAVHERDAFQPAVATAKIIGVRSARRIGREAIQMHGGMGLSEELRVGRLFRRLVAGEGHYGDADRHLSLFAARSANGEAA